MNWPEWSGQTAVIVATGPSARDVDLQAARGKARFLAIKDAGRLPFLCPWADALYGCDHHWWDAYRGLVEFAGVRMAYDPRTIEKWRGLGFLKVDIRKSHQEFLFDRIGEVGWGYNSGFHAVNLAVQFGAKNIILVGFDMRVDRGTHCFSDRPYKGAPSSGNIVRWAEILDSQAPVLSRRGIEVVNCSSVSALKAFRKISFEDAIETLCLDRV